MAAAALAGCHRGVTPPNTRLVGTPGQPAAQTSAGTTGGAPAQPAQANKPAEPEKTEPDATSLLYPHAVGSTWTLRMAGEQGSYDLLQVVMANGPSAVPGTFRIETRRAGEPIARDDYLVDEEGVFYVGTELPRTTQIEPPMPLLRLPLKSPATWSWKGVFRSQDSALPCEAIFTLSGPEETKTAAGAYFAYKVEQRLRVKAGSTETVTTTTQWLAPRVGLIKQTTATPTREGTAELLSYKEGKE